MWIEQHIINRDAPLDAPGRVQDVRTSVAMTFHGRPIREVGSMHGAAESALYRLAVQLRSDGWAIDWRGTAESFVAERPDAIQWARIGHAWSN